MENNLSPKDKVELCKAYQNSQLWSLVSAEIDEQIKFIESDISQALRKKDFEKASRCDGKKEQAQEMKNILNKIRRKNESIIDRVKNLLPQGR
mgnify:FL=1